ncbi:3-hydroxyisobutyrate dehydrogenase [Myxococcus sp. K15C18031901]|uniref:3-hydroxyisobutyrate dehydrogenase n=1 Tax=Myxococcus dinghuensis TaxID=2906761 RepID=UPI0020A721C0|nr:3-hydroxyisobutyrate dehydrogenase [Myxococcus dinghuensis]MCP3099433.1 3-hydroxyisobutyrate dehydrogenase [Myxococcus dinghuensis]
MKLAFLGLGNMGRPMAINLHKAGHEVVGFDPAPRASQRLSDAGIRTAPSARTAAEGSAAIISMLPAGEHVEALYLGDDGLLAHLAPSTLVIDCSTISAESARKVGAAAVARGIGCIDAPVSGGTAGAEAGTLTFMVGGAAEVLERARPLLEQMGKNVFHAGPIGAGQLTKMCNNLMLAIQMVGAAEALSLGAANGLSPQVLSDIMKRSSGGNWVLEKYNPVPGVMDGTPATRGYSGGFGTHLMLKDLGLAQENAVAVRAATPLGSLARSLYAAHCLAGHGDLDFSSIIRMFLKS